MLPCAVLGVAAAGVSWIAAGASAARSLALGVALATVFFVIGFGALRLVLAGAPSLQMVGALSVYAGQMLILFALIDVLGSLPWLHGHAFALGGLIAVVAWQAGQAWIVLRRRTPIYGDLDTPTRPTAGIAA